MAAMECSGSLVTSVRCSAGGNRYTDKNARIRGVGLPALPRRTCRKRRQSNTSSLLRGPLLSPALGIVAPSAIAPQAYPQQLVSKSPQIAELHSHAAEKLHQAVDSVATSNVVEKASAAHSQLLTHLSTDNVTDSMVYKLANAGSVIAETSTSTSAAAATAAGAAMQSLPVENFSGADLLLGAACAVLAGLLTMKQNDYTGAKRELEKLQLDAEALQEEKAALHVNLDSEANAKAGVQEKNSRLDMELKVLAII